MMSISALCEDKLRRGEGRQEGGKMSRWVYRDGKRIRW